MPAIFPPLDRIPNLPPQITDKAIQQLNKLVDQLGDKVVTVAKEPAVKQSFSRMFFKN